MSGARTPLFGDKVKIKVDIPDGDAGGPLPAGTIGVVLDPEGEGAIEVALPGVEERLYFEPEEVTTDLDWATPLEARILREFEAVLRKEKVADRPPRINRISLALLRAYAQGVEMHELDVRRAAQRELQKAELEAQAGADS